MTSKLIKKQKTKLNFFYGKSQNSFYSLKQCNETIKTIKKISSLNTIKFDKKSPILNISSHDNRNQCVKSSETKPDFIDLINSSINLDKNILSSDINIDSTNLSSTQDKLMGNKQTFTNSSLNKDSHNNLCFKNRSVVLQRIPSCSKMDEPDDIFIDKKRPKLDIHVESNVGSKVINDFALDITINKSHEELGQLNTKSNGLTKVCSCAKDKKMCRLCNNSSPILLDEDDSANSSAENIHQSNSSEKLFEYPKSCQTGRLTITKHDVKCLQPTEYLNDVIIDFYLKFINYHLLSKHERDKIHIFSSFFYSRLISISPKKCKNKTINSFPDIAIQRHNRICNWTRNIDIFEKDFILIPINQHQHWFLAIICFPNKCKDIYDQFRDKLDDPKISEMISDYLLNQNKRPCILIFDSLCPNPERWDVSTILREYLQVEWNVRKKSNEGSNIFKKKIMRGNSVKCPQQANSYDCGCYLLLYAEYFFTKPILSFRLPIRSCENWFSTIEGSKMRDKLKSIINDLTKQNMDIL